MKDSIVSYLKIMGGTLMISPLLYGFFRLDPNPVVADNAMFIVMATYFILWPFGIIGYNYLQHGHIFKFKEDGRR